jgi:hypothetical protein
MRTRAWWTTLSLVVVAGACGDQPTEPDVALSVASVALDPATKLAFGQQPTTTTSMLTISPQVTVRVLDAANALVTTSTVPVTLALGNNPPGGTLSGTLTKSAVNGVATFPDLSVAKAGTGYTLRASGPGLTSASSATFVIIRGPASRLRFVAQPTGGDPGQPFPVQPRVAVVDAGGNLASSGSGAASNISLALEPGSGPGGARLRCTANPFNATAGVAAFTGCALDLAATGYRLRATSGTLSPAVTDPFAVGAFNRPPVVSVGGPYGVAEGSALSLTPAVSDPDGDPLTYHWTVATTGLDAGAQCTFDDATAKNATITCTDDSQGAAGGKFLLTLEASDGTGTAVASADLTVSNAAPTIAWLTGPGGAALPATIVVGGTLDLWAPFGDAGGNDHHTATIQCDAGAGVSGLGAVISPLAAGCTFDLVGARTIGVRVTDDDGGWAIATHKVTVVYGLEGFFAPVRRPNALNLYRAGQAIPLRWRLTDVEGEPITTLTGVTVRASGVACPQGTTTDQVKEYPTGGSDLLNLGGGYYQLNWKTPASYASSCKSVALEFAPGYRTGTLAQFTFRP